MPENYIQLTSSDVIDHNEVNVDADDVSVAGYAGAGDASRNFALSVTV